MTPGNCLMQTSTQFGNYRCNAVTDVDIPEKTKISELPLCSGKAVVQQ